jgi:hypothetical protein
VRLTVAAVDDNGQRLPLTITRAVAFDLPDPRQAAGRPQVAIDFNDAGLGADLLAGDGTYSGLLAPALQGFADYAGTVRVQLELNQDGRSGWCPSMWSTSRWCRPNGAASAKRW